MNKSVRKLAIVGASVRAAAFSALRAGYEVVAADLFADADLRRVCPVRRIAGYSDALADWLAETECDGWLYTGALENHPELVDRMAKQRPLLGNYGESLRAVRDPLRLQAALVAAGLFFPETVAQPAGLPLDGSWLAKTYRGAAGAGVDRLDDEAALEHAVHHGAFFQRYVNGVSASVVFVLAEKDSKVLGVTRQLVGAASLGAKSWQYSGSVGPLGTSAALQSQLERLAEVLATSFRLRGIVGVDLVLADDKAWVIEINPRYTASVEIVERMTGEAAVAAHVAACTGRSIRRDDSGPSRSPDSSSDLRTAAAFSYGKTIIFAKQEVTMSGEFHRWAMKQATKGPQEYLLADIPLAGERIEAGRPVLTAFASASADEYDDVMAERIAEIESRLYSES